MHFHIPPFSSFLSIKWAASKLPLCCTRATHKHPETLLLLLRSTSFIRSVLPSLSDERFIAPVFFVKNKNDLSNAKYFFLGLKRVGNTQNPRFCKKDMDESR